MKSKIVILMLAALMLTGCGNNTNYNKNQNLQEDYGGGYFTIIQQWREDYTTHNIVYANDTKVKYYICWYNYEEKAGRSITPLYNADGSLQIYEEIK